MLDFLASSVRADSLVVVLSNGKSYTTDSTHSNWLQLTQALVNDDPEAFVEAFDVTKALEAYVTEPDHINAESGFVTVVNGQIFYLGEELRSNLVDRIYEMMSNGYEFRHMLMFLDSLYNNSSKNALDWLFPFLENVCLPITPDGCFLAYKTVKVYEGDGFTDQYGNIVQKGDFVDKYTGTVRNNPGDSPWMARNKVADDPNIHCSHGYHVGALGYAGPGGWYNNDSDVVIIVKVDPRDAVSVPNDHSCQKLRVCKYTVVAEYKSDLVRPVYDVEDSEQDWDENYDLVDEAPDFFEEEFLNTDDVWIGEESICVYERVDGSTANRVVEILEKHDYHFIVELLNGDAKFDLEPTNIRIFKFRSMSKIKYLER